MIFYLFQALGCILYTICFQKHPYADSSKLAILNANYNIPSDKKYTVFHQLISLFIAFFVLVCLN